MLIIEKLLLVIVFVCSILLCILGFLRSFRVYETCEVDKGRYLGFLGMIIGIIGLFVDYFVYKNYNMLWANIFYAFFA